MREQPYEKPLARGRLVFERDGRPVGRIESWRLSRALEGYHFLRADVDERESSGRSFLFNAQISPDGLVENLRYRFFDRQSRVRGQMLRESGIITNTREVNRQRYEEEIDAGKAQIWYPAVSGLTLLTRRPQIGAGFSVDVNALATPEVEKWFKIIKTTQTIEKNADEWVVTYEADGTPAVHEWRIGWNPDSGLIYHASNGEVVRVERNIKY